MMQVQHTDDGLRVWFDRARAWAVVDIPDEDERPIAWSLDEPVLSAEREYTHVILVDDLPGPAEQRGLALTTAEAEQLAEARRERGL